jgi:4-amino-4-deoxy-L-arabinose transferase-like glycosyltransferase
MGIDRRWSLALILGIVLLIRLPFLNQAVQGDDPKFIWIAQHALIDPAHPNHTQYIFQGEPVDMRGHPHPPGNSWVLASLIALFGDVREVPFHAAYALFSIIAALSMYALAKRFYPDDPLSPTTHSAQRCSSSRYRPS